MAEGSPSWWAAENIARWRSESGTSAEELAKRVTALGLKMERDALVGIENRTRASLSVEELFAFAMALNVSPNDLVLPHEYEGAGRRKADLGIAVKTKVRLTEKVSAHPYFLRAWLIHGQPFLDGADHFEATRKAPEHERREDEASRHPAMLALIALRAFMRDAILGPTEVITPQLMATGLRDYLGRLNRHVELLADDLEALQDWNELKEKNR